MTNQCRHVCYITHACIFLCPYYRHLPARGRSGRVVLISIVETMNSLYEEGEIVAEIVVFRCGKMKTGFQCIYPTWEQIKNTRHIFQNMSDLF